MSLLACRKCRSPLEPPYGYARLMYGSTVVEDGFLCDDCLAKMLRLLRGRKKRKRLVMDPMTAA